MFRLHIFLSFAVALALVIALPAWADEGEQDIARDAMLSGDVVPLSQLLAIVEKSIQGDVLKIELENESVTKWGGAGDGMMFIYEIKILTRKGKLLKLKYDAKSLKLLATNRYDAKSK